MNKLKVIFDNTAGDAPLTIFGRNKIFIPGAAQVEILLPDAEQTRSLVSRLRREYPVLKISIEAMEAPSADSEKPAGQVARNTVPVQPEKTEHTAGSGKKGKPEAAAEVIHEQ